MRKIWEFVSTFLLGVLGLLGIIFVVAIPIAICDLIGWGILYLFQIDSVFYIWEVMDHVLCVFLGFVFLLMSCALVLAIMLIGWEIKKKFIKEGGKR